MKKMSTRELAKRGDRIYDEKLKAELEPKHLGEIVAIHVETGDYFLGRDPLEACDKGREKHPGAVFFCRRVGDTPVYRVGAF